jgi:hypothetical protein
VNLLPREESSHFTWPLTLHAHRPFRWPSKTHVGCKQRKLNQSDRTVLRLHVKTPLPLSPRCRQGLLFRDVSSLAAVITRCPESSLANLASQRPPQVMTSHDLTPSLVRLPEPCIPSPSIRENSPEATSDRRSPCRVLSFLLPKACFSACARPPPPDFTIDGTHDCKQACELALLMPALSSVQQIKQATPNTTWSPARLRF